MLPFFTFYGGKWRAAPHYPKPRYEKIIEPFAGAAGYSMRYPDHDITLIDADPVIVDLWRYLISADPQRISSLPDVPDGCSIQDMDVSDPEKYLIGFWLNKGTTRPSNTPSKWMRSRIRPNSYWGPAVRERIASQVEYIRHWNAVLGDYTDSPDVEATWFIDPPYQHTGSYYKVSTVDYESLADFCKSRKGQVMVCEGPGADWLPFRHFIDIKASESPRGGRVSKEMLWTA